MIEIIKRGTKQRTKCEYCGCEFKFEDEDVDVTIAWDRECEYVQCPQCDEKVILKQIK